MRKPQVGVAVQPERLGGEFGAERFQERAADRFGVANAPHLFGERDPRSGRESGDAGHVLRAGAARALLALAEADG